MFEKYLINIFDNFLYLCYILVKYERCNKMDKENNRERFVRIAEARTQKIIDTLRLLGNCSNCYAYEYTQKDIDKIFSAIETEIKNTKAKFVGSGTKDSKFKL